MKARQPTEGIWVICTSKTWDSAQPGRAWPCDPAAPKLPGSLTGNGLIYLFIYCGQSGGFGKGPGGGFHHQAMVW